MVTGLVAISQIQVGNSGKSYEDKLNEEFCSTLFRSTPGTILDIESANVSAYFNILDWLNGRVAGLQVFVTRFGVRIPVMRGAVSNIYIDEIPVDPGFLNMLSVNDIGMIKIIKGPFVGAFGNGNGGTIAIYTLKGEDDEEQGDSK